MTLWPFGVMTYVKVKVKGQVDLLGHKVGHSDL